MIVLVMIHDSNTPEYTYKISKKPSQFNNQIPSN